MLDLRARDFHARARSLEKREDQHAPTQSLSRNRCLCVGRENHTQANNKRGKRQKPGHAIQNKQSERHRRPTHTHTHTLAHTHLHTQGLIGKESTAALAWLCFLIVAFNPETPESKQKQTQTNTSKHNWSEEESNKRNKEEEEEKEAMTRAQTRAETTGRAGL